MKRRDFLKAVGVWRTKDATYLLWQADQDAQVGDIGRFGPNQMIGIWVERVKAGEYAWLQVHGPAQVRVLT